MNGDILEAEVWTVSRLDDGGQVMLRPAGGDLVVPLFVDEGELAAIVRGLDRAAPERPGVHCLFADFIVQSGFELLRAEIYGLKGGLVRARLIFTGGSRPDPLALEAAPADALALALCSGRPIALSGALVKKAGVPAETAL